MNPLQTVLLVAILVVLWVPSGNYMVRLFRGERTFLSGALEPLERLFYRTCGISPDDEMTWPSYGLSMLLFNFFGMVSVHLLLRSQDALIRMIALTARNFVWTATGIAVLLALLRAVARRSVQRLGSFWVDLTRATLYVLLPLSLVVVLATDA